MGFRVEFNSILRSDNYGDLTVGKIYDFNKAGSRVFFDDIPVWLCNSDWQVLAEISIMSQTRENANLTGTFRVDYIYSGEEQKTISKVFVRMYDGVLSPYIYLLSSQSEYENTCKTGELVRDSLSSEGFIHASPKSQLNRVANKYYKETAKPLVITLELEKIEPSVLWEPATGGLYPHIYGPLNTSAIKSVQPIALNAHGEFDIKI
ncbi:DUF952 domain-containing protein [Agaribacter flavus]|uniref:DUF952 domain-containing protein n=1 Tax=Agaribacter flavus TaxID=1902781 RepID=A0ABV7FPZ3_9ALTE